MASFGNWMVFLAVQFGKAALHLIHRQYFNEKEDMEYIDYVKDEELRYKLKKFTDELINDKTAANKA